MLNKAILMGRITADLELKTTPSGNPVVSFNIAVDRDYAAQGEKKQTDFIGVVAWRNTAEFISKYFSKGQMIAVSGRLQTRSYEDREGNKHNVTEVLADSVYFAGDKPNGSKKPAAVDADDVEFGDLQDVDEDGELPF